MDYAEILEQLEKASLFDVYRLHAAMGMMMEDPLRLAQVRERLVPGQEVSYFHWQENRLIRAKILELKRTRVFVLDQETGARYSIPMYWINTEGSDLPETRHSNTKGIPRNELRVGDQVGFRDRNNMTRCGQVTRLNPKTATLLVDGRSKWRVGYGLLFDMIDGQAPQRKLVANKEV